jgi:Raf kinase inhibitor-like YbhB/YbcL family protein
MSLKLGNLKLTSSAFQPLGRMPKSNAGDGENKSPRSNGAGLPAVRSSLDSSAMTLTHRSLGFTHWVVYGIPAATTRLPEGQPADAFVGGVNDTGKPGYVGPYPPNGHGPHHYYFWLFALGSASLRPGMNRIQFLDAIKDKTLEQARLVGVYER